MIYRRSFLVVIERRACVLWLRKGLTERWRCGDLGRRLTSGFDVVEGLIYFFTSKCLSMYQVTTTTHIADVKHVNTENIEFKLKIKKLRKRLLKYVTSKTHSVIHSIRNPHSITLKIFHSLNRSPHSIHCPINCTPLSQPILHSLDHPLIKARRPLM